MSKKVVDATRADVVDQVEDQTVDAGKGEVVTPSDTKEQTKEENAKYAAARREAEAKLAEELEKARKETADNTVKEMAEALGLEGITTKEEFDTALREQEYERQAKESGKNVDELRKIDELKAENEKLKKQQEKQLQYQQLFQEFPDIDVNKIPVEIWQKVDKGENLVSLYRKFELDRLKEELDELKGKKKADEVNTDNKKATTGSVQTMGTVDKNFISSEEFEAHKKDQDWVKNNLDTLRKSQSKW